MLNEISSVDNSNNNIEYKDTNLFLKSCTDKNIRINRKGIYFTFNVKI